jgi:phospholipase C
MFRKLCVASSFAAAVALTGCGNTGNLSTPGTVTVPATAVAVAPSTAIKHVVVIFGENISFDHYFGTYPNAANTGGTTFTAAAGTPTPNNYITNPALMTANPNLSSGNGGSSANPFRLGPNQAGTGDQGHNYAPEQLAFDGGKMDLFPASVGAADSAALVNQTAAPGIAGTTALTMGYYDGNTVTAMWNYAQHYSMNDHSFGTSFGPSTPGAINLVSGQTNGLIPNPALALATAVPGSAIPDGQGGYTMINDITPTNEACPDSTGTALMSGKNIGDLLNTAGVTWGFFEGGFNLGTTNANGTTGCGRTTGAVNIPGHPLKADYIAHHEPFQYYPSTANPTHIRPASVAVIGTAADTGSTKANHQYDMADFDAALAAGNLPAVSILKAPGYQDAHAGYSDPLDEQAFVVKEINAIQSSPFWQNTAIIIAYDDSDGWYDHLSMLVNGSQTPGIDQAFCNGTAPTLVGPNTPNPVQGRCGYGPRLPLLVISPFAKKNFIDSTVTDQSSVTRFIEDIFLGSQRLGGGSTDTTAGSLMNMFNFTTTSGVAPNANVVLLNATTGAVTTGN